MRTAIIGMRFKDEAKDEDIEEVVSDFYANNDNIIKGMVYLEFKDPKTLDEIYKFINEKEPSDTTQKMSKLATQGKLITS